MDIPKLNTHKEADSFLANVFTSISDILVGWEKDRRECPWVHLKRQNGWYFFINKRQEYTALYSPLNSGLYWVAISIKNGRTKQAHFFESNSDIRSRFYSKENRLPQVVYEERSRVLIDNYTDGTYSKIGVYRILFHDEHYLLYEDRSRQWSFKPAASIFAVKDEIREKIKMAMEYRNVKRAVV